MMHSCSCHSPVEAPESQPAKPKRRSKVRSERVALLVLCALLAAALIVIYRLSFVYWLMKKNLQMLTEENEAQRKDLTGIKPGSTVQPWSQKPPEDLTKEDRTCVQCDEGWEHHGGQCYYFSINKLTWQVSRQECIFEGGDLVKIDSRDEQEFLERRLRDQMMEPADRFWIGLTDSKEEGRWLWVDGSPLNTSLTFWDKREPNNWNIENPKGEDCVRMGEKDGSHDLMCWFDKSCKIPHRRICEKSAVSV
ncbi:hepatic lectin-like [Embiotoca jacksoni]|uniref:hepatic lectin-like n=1 Tax=Embiotoca jacksoni TaxID=100190 RepID=UPI0037044A70